MALIFLGKSSLVLLFIKEYALCQLNQEKYIAFAISEARVEMVKEKVIQLHTLFQTSGIQRNLLAVSRAPVVRAIKTMQNK